MIKILLALLVTLLSASPIGIVLFLADKEEEALRGRIAQMVNSFIGALVSV